MNAIQRMRNEKRGDLVSIYLVNAGYYENVVLPSLISLLPCCHYLSVPLKATLLENAL